MTIQSVAAVPAPADGLVAGARSAVDHLAALVASLDTAAFELSGGEAAELTGLLARLERLAGAGKTLAAGRLAATGGYREAGYTTPAQCLSSIGGGSAYEAARTLETAARIAADGNGGLDEVRRAFVAGDLTAAQASEIASAAARHPEEQGRLLAFARRETATRLKEECRRVRLAGRPADDRETRRKRLVEELSFRHRELGDGLGELVVRMPTSWLVLAVAAVRQQCEAVFARARAEGRADPHQAYLVEALVTLLLFGDLGGGGSAGGEDIGEDLLGEAASPVDVIDDPLYDQLLATIRGGPIPTRRSRRRRGRCPCGGRVTPKPKIIIRVDQAALLRGHAEGDEVCEIAGIGPVPVATVRELWPDAVVNLVVTAGVDVRNVTTLSRRATAAFETAMQYAVPRCSNIACDHDAFVEIDHRVGWANVHRTRLDELDWLCTQCHDRKSRENWQLVRGAGRRRFVPADDPDHPGDPPTPVRRR